MIALRQFVEHPRPNGITVRYEDLASHPNETLSEIGTTLGLDVSGFAREFMTNTRIPARVRDTMRGLRPISTHSVGRWRSHPELAARLHDVVPDMREHLGWVSERFGYDVTLP